jgi:peptidoglycan/xylan/chitin deacetylase (PgdA/CDA1 family)
MSQKVVKRKMCAAGVLFLTLAGTALPMLAFPEYTRGRAAKAWEAWEAWNARNTVNISNGSMVGQDAFAAEVVQVTNELLAAGFGTDLPEMSVVNWPGAVTAGCGESVKERCDILVMLDVGQGGEDEDCSSGDIYEKNINLQIARAVEKRLLDLDYQVLRVREDEREVSLEERAGNANHAGADIYISIHRNACEEDDTSVSGIEVWYNEEKGESDSRRLERLLQDYTDAAERELLTVEDAQDRLAEAIVSAVDLYFFPKTMYLTFDDGPTAENTVAVLDILKAHDIQATFFLVGENVEKHPEVARRIAEEGHTIGIHCYNHDYESLYESVDSYVADFEKARKAVYEATGVEVQLFRFPGGSINSYNQEVYRGIVEEMTDRGYVYFDWNASLEDAARQNEPERLLRNAKESTLGRRRVVMLAHDTVYNTTLCLEELLEEFPEYRMLPLTEEVEPIQF